MGARRAAAVCGLALSSAVAAAFLLAPKAAITTHTDVAAPPGRVWATLTDTAKYAEWQPDLRLSGRLEPGQVIEVRQADGPDVMVFHPVVLLVVRPNAALAWRGRIWLPRVFDAVHYFQLAADGNGTRLTQGEAVRGVALWLFDMRDLVPAFDRVNAQIKRRAEE